MSTFQPHFKEIIMRDFSCTLFGGISGIGTNKKSIICQLTSGPQELLLRRPCAKGRSIPQFIHLIP